MDYSSKVVWITGASAGIGEALSLKYAELGATVILSARNVENLNAIKLKMADPNRVHVVGLDLSNHDSLSDTAQQVVRDFDVDILINNAGLSQRSLVKDTEIDVYKKLMDINYLGTVVLSKVVLSHYLKKDKGQFVVISSVAGKFGVPVRSGYSASKFALHGFFEALRAELKETQIKITMICPGYIKTNISLNALTGDGKPQNTMDDAQNQGMSTSVFVQKAISAIEKQKAEVNIGGFKETKLAVWVSRIFPSLFRKIIAQSKVT